MPNKSVPGYTQVPVIGNDILNVNHSRSEAGATINVDIVYIVRDDQGAERGRNSTSMTTATYPASGASVLSQCNTAEGT